MSRLDPFIIYTIRLFMERVSKDTGLTKKSCSTVSIAQIMSIKTWSDIKFDKPKLEIGYPLSLLYHADEQWLTSTQELSHLVKIESDRIKKVEEQVHRQQRIFLDTLHIIQGSMKPSRTKRYLEPIWFAAQAIHNKCHVKELERFTDTLQPFATQLYQALECVRLKMRKLLQKRTESSFFSFLSRPRADDLTELDLENFQDIWCKFEDVLYDCYVHTVFDKHAPIFLSRNTPDFPRPIVNELFNDTFTQILSLTLNRALDQNLLEFQSIQCCEPLALIALPRLAVLAGVTWLSHITNWRTRPGLPIWIRAQTTSLQRVVTALESIESSLLPHEPILFVERYQLLEQALVFGNQKQDTELYLDICNTADSILTGPKAQSFSTILGILFRNCVNESPLEHVLQGDQDAIPIEQTVLDLSI